MKKRVTFPVALGISTCLVAELAFGEGKPHAEFLAVSPTVNDGAFVNGTPTVTTFGVFNDPFLPAEWKIPHARVVIRVSGLSAEEPGSKDK